MNIKYIGVEELIKKGLAKEEEEEINAFYSEYEMQLSKEVKDDDELTSTEMSSHLWDDEDEH